MNSTESPYKHTLVGQAAMAGGVEAGYDIFSAVNKLSEKQKFYVFGRYTEILCLRAVRVL